MKIVLLIKKVLKINVITNLALQKIKPKMIVSLGGGSNVQALAEALATSKLKEQIALVSPSELTRIAGQTLGLQIRPLSPREKINLAFDGCDSVDYHLNALKSKGGIHVFEKAYAERSQQYILLTPYQRIKKILDSQVFLSVEVASPCLNNVYQDIVSLGLKPKIRLGEKVAAYARSPLGNYLIDVYSSSWQNIAKLNQQIEKLNGVVATSYFKNLVTSIITEKDGHALEIKKGDLK